MKKFLIGTAAVLCVFIAFFSISFSLDNTMKYNRLAASAGKQLSDLRTRVTRLEDDNCFVILREYDGIIGIYDKNEKILLGTINVAVKTLPVSDKAKLKDGLEVTDSEKLISLFEDFSS